ncbi:MAG TPA: phosphatase PAP2 family protein [Actinomycetota bacterium]|jgi:undecaprenyl-diphosphatase
MTDPTDSPSLPDAVARSPGDRLREAGLLTGAALLVEFASSTGRGHRADVAVFRAVNRGHGPAADAFFGRLTELGSITGSASAAVALAVGGRRRAAMLGAGAAGSMWLVGQGLKKLYDRMRPYDRLPDLVRLLIGRPPGTSWPSSHPAVILAFLTVAGQELGLSRIERTAVNTLAGLVAVSRVYLGVHYPSDVVAGLLLGRAVGQTWLAAAGSSATDEPAGGPAPAGR